MTTLTLRTMAVSVGALIAATAFGAHAADIYGGPGGFKDGPYVPVNTWTGFYVGVNGGYGFRNDGDSNKTIVTGPGISDKFNGPAENGAFGGGQIGYNIQRNHLVYGVEADFQGADISDTHFAPGASGTGKIDSSLDWFGTVRGRLGYAYGRGLIYFTGGLAFGDVTDTVTYTTPKGNAFRGTLSDTQTGFVVGGGLEYAITPAWSWKAEYQYLDLGSERVNGTFSPSGDAGRTSELDHNFQSVRLGFNYKLDHSNEPLK